MLHFLTLCLLNQAHWLYFIDFQYFMIDSYLFLIVYSLLYLKKKVMSKYLIALIFVGFIQFSFAQTSEKVQFEYTSFAVTYNENGEQKFKQSEDLIQSVSRSMKTESKEIDKGFYYAKTMDETMALLGKSGFELVTAIQTKTKEGIEVRFYFKKKIVL